MKHHTTKHSRGWRRRALSALGALVITASAWAVTASAVSAEMACHWPPEGGSNTCLTIEPVGNGFYSVHVGIDIQMSPQAAQTIIAENGRGWGQPLAALIMAHDHDDPAADTTGLFELHPQWVAAGNDGLSAEFYDNEVHSSQLNEDDGQDEVCARVILYFDSSTNLERIFHSGCISGNYSNGSGGGGGPGGNCGDRPCQRN
jgi:hypothetical protein